MIYYCLSGNFKKIIFRVPEKMINVHLIDYFFAGISLTLLLFNLLGLNNILSLFFAILASFFLPGYVLLKLLKFHSLNSCLEWLVLSFALSIGLTSLIYSLALPFTAHRSLLISVIYFGFSLCSFLKDRIKPEEKQQFSEKKKMIEHNFSDVLLLLWILLFIISAISSLYPKMAYRPALDIVRHFSSSKLLTLASDAYASPYPWFHMAWAVIYELSRPAMDAFQTGLAYLSLMVIFSFYIMAKAYLSNIDNRAPIIATVFFSVFSGFGWLHFLMEKLKTQDPTIHLKLLSISSNSSYWDVGYSQGPWLWLWFRPLTVGFTNLFVLMYLLNRKDLDKKSFFIINYLTVLSLSMTHFSELVFYTILLLAISLVLAPRFQFRLKDSLLTLLLALTTTLGISLFYNLMSIKVKVPLSNIAISLIIASISLLIIKLKPHISIVSHIFKKRTIDAYYVIASLLAIWAAMLLYWFANANNFKVSLVSSIFGVPWILYPVLLGICGLLTFPGIVYLFKYNRNRAAIVFVLMLIVSIVFGRLLTYINLYWYKIGYWERRIIPLSFSASSIISSILICHIAKRIRARHIFSSLLFSLIVITGLNSTILTIEYQSLATQRHMLTPSEQDQVVLLNELNPQSYLLTLSYSSLKLTEFAPFAWRIGYFRDHIWPAKSPELVLNSLFSTGHPAIIYLSKEDYARLKGSAYAESYIKRHLLHVLPSYNCADIYQIQGITPPAENSNIVLVVPENYSTINCFYAYDILSSAGYNYTTMHISDMETLVKAEIIVVPSEILASKILDLKNDLKLNFRKLIILNLDGYYGKLSGINYPSFNIILTSADYGEAHLEDPTHQNKTLKNVKGIKTTPFILETTASNNSLILGDDDASGFWRASASLRGNLSIPKLTDDEELKISGKNSLRIEVYNGSYAQWQVSWVFRNVTDLEAYDFISFYWYGKGDGVKYVIQINTNTPGKYFWYQFVDSWTGWKKVILPMHIDDGSYSIYGVHINKATKNQASWRNVKRIDFKLSGANLNVGGIFHIDRFAFERSTLVNLKVVVHGSIQALKLLNLNRNAYVPIAQINSDGTVPIPEYYLLNGISTKNILGKYAGNLTFSRYNQTYSEAFIEIKLPILPEESYHTQAEFAVAPIYKMNKASNIKVGSSVITLPVQVNIVPFETKAKPLAYYGDEKTFFASEASQDQVNITYLNFYPLVSAIEDGSRELHPLIGNMTRLILGDLSSYKYRKEPINSGSTAAFREAVLEGNVTVSFESVIIRTENAGSIEVTINGNVTYQFDGNKEFNPANFRKAIMKTTYMKITPGSGFYIKAFVDNATLTLFGDQINLISSLNNYVSSLKGNVITIKIENATLFLRRPFISVDGQGSFKDLYTYHELNKRIRALGDDCKINGHFTFMGAFGDTYTIVKDFNYSGSVKLPRPLYGYDELRSFIEMLPYLLLVAVSYIVFAALKILKGKSENE